MRLLRPLVAKVALQVQRKNRLIAQNEPMLQRRVRA